MEKGLDTGTTDSNPTTEINVVKQSSTQKADIAISTKQAEIIKAIAGAVKQFKKENRWLVVQLILWIVLSILLILKGYCIIKEYIDNVSDKTYLDTFKNFQNWQIYFYVIARLTLMVGLFSIASFCLRMFRSTYHIFQSNRHRINVVEVLPSFMAASKDPIKEEEILAIILKTVIKYNKTGLITKEADIKSGISFIERLISKTPH